MNDTQRCQPTNRNLRPFAVKVSSSTQAEVQAEAQAQALVVVVIVVFLLYIQVGQRGKQQPRMTESDQRIAWLMSCTCIEPLGASSFPDLIYALGQIEW